MEFLFWSADAGSSTGIDYQNVSAGLRDLSTDTNNDVTTAVTDNGDGTVTMVTSRSLDTGDVADDDFVIELDNSFPCYFILNRDTNNVNGPASYIGTSREVMIPSDGSDAEIAELGAMSLISAAAASLIALALF